MCLRAFAVIDSTSSSPTYTFRPPPETRPVRTANTRLGPSKHFAEEIAGNTDSESSLCLSGCPDTGMRCVRNTIKTSDNTHQFKTLLLNQTVCLKHLVLLSYSKIWS